MTWFHLILGIYVLLTVGPLLIALCIDTPENKTEQAESKPAESPVPNRIPSQQTN